MKFSKRLILTLCAFSGLLVLGTVNTISVQAAENNSETTTDKTQVTYPIYEVNGTDSASATNEDHPLNKNATFSIGEDNTFNFPADISNGRFGTDGSATYTPVINGQDGYGIKGYFDAQTGIAYSDEAKTKPISKLYVLLGIYRPTVNYVDQETGEVVGHSSNENLYVDPVSRKISLDDADVPTSCKVIDPDAIVYHPGDSLSELNVPVHKYVLSDLPE